MPGSSKYPHLPFGSSPLQQQLLTRSLSLSLSLCFKEIMIMLRRQVPREVFVSFTKCSKLSPCKIVPPQILLPPFLGCATEEYKCAFQQDKHGGSGPI